MHRMMDGATLDGLLGGVLAERTTVFIDQHGLLLLLADLHTAQA